MPVLPNSTASLAASFNYSRWVGSVSDRTSASLFAEIFKVIAEHVPPGGERDALGSRMWALTQDYDFSSYQMYADASLLALGLARHGVDPDWPDDGEVVLYGPTPSATDSPR